MGRIYHTSNPAEFTDLEGVVINEIAAPSVVRGIGTRTLAVCGETLKGPVDKPVTISTISRFEEVFGGRSHVGATTSVNKVREFLLNKQFGPVVVVRAAPTAAVAASFNAEDGTDGTGTEILTISASSKGIWGNDLKFKVVDASDGDANKFNLILKYDGKELVTYQNIDVSGSNDNTATVLGLDVDANLITLTKLASGRPSNNADFTGAFASAVDSDDFLALGTTVSGFTSVAGTAGTIADTDYTATDRAMDKAFRFAGVSFCAVADRQTAAIKAKILGEAALVADRIFLMWNGTHGETTANIITDAALYRDDRIVYCNNSPTTIDDTVALEIETPPHGWVASVLTQLDVDQNPIIEDSKQFTARIKSLNKEDIPRADYVSLRAAGVCTWEKDLNGGFKLASGVVNVIPSAAGEELITTRRSKDFLTLSVANALRYFVGKKNTPLNRVRIKALVSAFLEGLRADDRIVEDFAVLQDEVNTVAGRALGKEEILMRVNLIDHSLFLVLNTEIGTAVEISGA